MENNIQKLKKDIEIIKERNSRVEADKAWEISWTRRLFIAISTYIIAGIWLVLIEDSLPWFKAFVPFGGYLLSTFSLSFVKKWWVENMLK